MTPTGPVAWTGAISFFGGIGGISAGLLIYLFSSGLGFVALVVACAGVAAILVGMSIVLKVGGLPWRGEITKEQYERLGKWNGRWF